jgi:hypothetical protein
MSTVSSPPPQRQESARDAEDESPPHYEAPSIAPAASPKYKRRRFIGENETPEHALTWKTAPQRSKLMFAWQLAVMALFSSRAPILRVAWLLSTLCLKEGYAYATDSYIARTLDIQLNHVQAAITALERKGAIVRASSFVAGKPQRRIWPSTKIIPPNHGGMNTPRSGTQDTPQILGTDSLRNTRHQKTPRITPTQTAARKQAELREEADQRRAQVLEETPRGAPASTARV